jgi:hypothetical protein
MDDRIQSAQLPALHQSRVVGSKEKHLDTSVTCFLSFPFWQYFSQPFSQHYKMQNPLLIVTF